MKISRPAKRRTARFLLKGKNTRYAHADHPHRRRQQGEALKEVIARNIRMVEEKLETAIRAGRGCGMQDGEIRELFDLMMEE